MAVFHVSLYLCISHALRVLYGREILVEPVMCLKRLITVEFGSFEPFHFAQGKVVINAGLNGHRIMSRMSVFALSAQRGIAALESYGV